jgi:hypothetical protein
MSKEKKKCQNDGCQKNPCYNNIGDNRGIYCKTHKLKEMIDVVHRTCFISSCSTRPSYNNINEISGKFCKEHKMDNMINVVDKTCLITTCLIQPVYNIKGSSVPLYCKKHKLCSMVDIINKRCQRTGCSKYPIYGYMKDKKRIFCKDHKLDDMINVKNKKCEYDKCIKIPSFNIIGEKKGRFCKEHKLDNMINVTSKKCEYNKCMLISSFNIIGEKKGRFCKEHKLNKMVDVRNNNICVYNDCVTRSSYGKLFMKKTHCAKHKHKNEYFKNLPICSEVNCKNIPYFTSSGNYPERCKEHKLENDQNIIETKCIKCGLMWYINNSSKMCNDCDEFFIQKTVKHTKEDRIKDVLNANGIDYKSHDKIPDFSCSKYRPDFIIDKPLFTIILEVDENQHKSYACECEQGRMIQLHNDFGGTPIVFIRYNPDSYKDHNGKTKRANKKRESNLIDLINSLNNKKEWTIPLSVYYMYYDGYQEDVDTLIEIKYL